MNKAELLETLRQKRAELDALVAQIPPSQMTVPGAAGEWSIKDFLIHLDYHERWYADRLAENIRGEIYTPTEVDALHWDARNQVVYERTRTKPLDAVLAERVTTFAALLAGVEGNSEAFLTEPRQFEGAPQPLIVWQMLRDDVYEHYAQHIPSLEQWIATRREQT